jgi:nucleotide-binding universal stress UspA family protein
MFGSILLPVDGSVYSEWGRSIAARLLSKDGTLNFLYVVDIVALEGTFLQDIAGAVGAEPFMNLSPKLERVLHEKGQAVLDTQKSACQKEGLSASTQLETGIVGNVISKHAVANELVVIGRHGRNEKFSTGLAGSTTESVLRKSPRPVLVVSREPGMIRRVLLGFDGSKPAAHAMAEAARFCKGAGLPLTVLVVGEEDKATDETASEAARYLEPTGIQHQVEVRRGKANEELVNAAAGYDLLIVGAFGHSRIIEMVLGSTTEYLLRNSPVPTLFVR